MVRRPGSTTWRKYLSSSLSLPSWASLAFLFGGRAASQPKRRTIFVVQVADTSCVDLRARPGTRACAAIARRPSPFPVRHRQTAEPPDFSTVTRLGPFFIRLGARENFAVPTISRSCGYADGKGAISLCLQSLSTQHFMLRYP